MSPTLSLLTREDCEKILHRSVDSPGQLLTHKIRKFNDNVAGFLGEHYQLTIKHTAKNNTTQSTYFVKALPLTNHNQLEYVQESGIFRKEVILYQNLLTELNKIGNFAPKCYFIKDSCIVLEDMKTKGFEMLQKEKYLDETHCIAMLKTLAKYHSSTIIYERKRNITLDQKFKEEIKEASFSFTEGQPRQKWCVCVTKCVNDLIKLLPIENCDTICAKFERFVFEKMPQMLAPSKQFVNVLTHDDLWCNNLLFNDKPECVFVDFQLVRYTPPALDFLISLFLNLPYTYAMDNFTKIVDIYYKFLVEELKKHNLDERELSRQEFDQTLDFYKLAALTETAMYASHIYISEKLSNEIVADFHAYNEFSFINRSKYAVKEFQENSHYRERVSSILKPLVELIK
ncbi:uncharacterized protein LOC663958 [Tribolium castaneum]|uniref:CHK kinase-like domain-containing protein n=1 Tax=Tribolium castaneum TaxID=7070 RepID=D2A2D6_TRICA|nr:PREDICTED: uncharacterized protein LOC663958 [Tribolium castaneum]EFA02038.1 hypothetical protein TcasGA2_TC007665 [Tribolium castaneum]|eukprot:XP_015835019.1 PREDICTED: uncharacterized protein LOC663958 [Tribolium castaneum]